MEEPKLMSYFYNESEFQDNYSTILLDPRTFACKPEQISHEVNIAICAFYIMVFLLAIPGNLVVGVVVCYTKQILTPSDLYLFHLSVADTLLALTLPFRATAVMWSWVFGNFMCKLVSVTQELSFYSSILFLVCISVDRYLVIVRAMEVQLESRRSCSWATCIAVWVLGATISLSALFNSVQPNGQCLVAYNPNTAQTWRLVMRLLEHTVGFIIPLEVMLICYYVIVARLLRTRGFHKLRAMRVIVAVMATFLLFRTPYHLAIMVDTLQRAKLITHNCKDRNFLHQALNITQGLAFLHSCANPLLYAFIGEKFRRNLCQLFGRMRAPERGSWSSRSISMTSDPTALSETPALCMCTRIPDTGS